MSPTFSNSLGPVSLVSCHVHVCSMVIQLGLVYIVGGVPMAVKTLLTSCFPCLLDCWYLLHCFHVIFFCLSDSSEISVCLLSLFNMVYRACSARRYSYRLDGSASRHWRYTRWHPAFVFLVICKNMVYVKIYSYKTFL